MSTAGVNVGGAQVTDLRGGYDPRMVEACYAALDAGVFYQDQFTDFVIEQLGGHGCEAVLLREVILRESEYVIRRELLAAVEEQIVNAPRGCYVLLRHIRDGVSDSWTAQMSNGRGYVSGRHDIYRDPPSSDRLLQRMLGNEVYLCRKYCTYRREVAAGQSAITLYGLRAGAEYRDYRGAAGRAMYSTAVITHTDFENGSVNVLLIKRGSARRWTTTLYAHEFVQRVAIKNDSPGELFN